MDVNMTRAEDVLAHKRLLELAKDSVQRQAFAVGGRASELFLPPRDTRNNIGMQIGATLMESKFGYLQFYYLV